MASLSQLTASARRLALVGLAKNTGKTVALATLLEELGAAGRRVGVTSVGRDGEQHDVIDARIDKPLVKLGAGAIVATTDGLLRASGIPHELLARTGARTPLGEVLIARMKGPGAIEVAGPSTASEVAQAAEAMLSFGAEQVLIDGAIDRRAASSPDVSDALLMSTGAVLGDELGEVVARTVDAVALVRLPTVPSDTAAGRRLHELAAAHRLEPRSLLVGAGVERDPSVLPPRFVLSAQATEIGSLVSQHPDADTLLVAGALPEAFVRDLALAARRGQRELTVVVADPTRAFLSERGPEHYRRQGVAIETLRPVDLRALTVNPLAPRSHSFDSVEMRALLGQAIPGLPVFDVLHPDYGAAQQRPGPDRAAADS
ncbi:MAG: hypothetical protein ACLQBB_01840 [Solirubrobacteraceae bacterium]